MGESGTDGDVSANLDGSGSGPCTPECKGSSNNPTTQMQISANAKPGYYFHNWGGEGICGTDPNAQVGSIQHDFGPTDNPMSKGLTANSKCYAAFYANTATVTANAAQNGDVNVVAGNYKCKAWTNVGSFGSTGLAQKTTINCTTPVLASTDFVSLTAVPYKGVAGSDNVKQDYKFGSWSGTCPISGSTNPNQSYAAGTKSTTCQASFVPDFSSTFSSLSVSVAPKNPGVGTVSVSSGNYNATCTYDKSCEKGIQYGQIVSLAAMPADGYKFDSWSVDPSGTIDATNSSPGFTMKEVGVKLVANFVPNGAQVRVDILSGGTVSANYGDSTATCTAASACVKFVKAAHMVTLSAIPSKGFKFGKWNGATCPNSGSNNPTNTFPVGNKNIACEPSFGS